MGRLFLGLDSSTQSLSAILIDMDEGRVVYDDGINFSAAFPQYGTENGVLRNPDPKTVHAPPLMWLDALDALLGKMKESGVDFSSVLAVSGSGQQHGSVYLNKRFADKIARLNPDQSLAENLAGVFSRKTAPIWMDSSTGEECREICAALGGKSAMAAITGSTAFERFTGPQIRRFCKRNPEDYAETAVIALVSSFMASVLAGKVAPIDHGDGAGMNLMDISTKHWHPGALEATAPKLGEKLPPLAPSGRIVGTINSYFIQKYGFSPETAVQVWSGDNPCSLIGLGLTEPGLAAISCGTSDTYFGFMSACHTDPRGEGHVFGAPTGDYMSLICFKNGSLAREKVKNAYGYGWPEFCAALRNTVPGNAGKMMLPYFEPEIVPRVLEPGVRRLNLREDEAEANCRAVVEAQMMSMRLHSAWMGERPKKIYATGGGSRDPEILQIMADVHNCPVIRFETGNSAALGAAVRAAHGWLKKQGETVSWRELIGPFLSPDPDRSAEPDPAAVAVYDEMIAKYAEFEKQA